MLRERIALVIHENKNAKKIYRSDLKPDLKHIGLCEPRILEFEFNSLYERARLALRLQIKQWFYIDFVARKSNTFLKLSFEKTIYFLGVFP